MILGIEGGRGKRKGAKEERSKQTERFWGRSRVRRERALCRLDVPGGLRQGFY